MDSERPEFGPAQPIAVLVAGGDERLVHFLSKRLPPLGYRVVAVSGGNEALAELRDQRFDVALCDLMMIQADAFDVLRFFKTLEDPPPIVVMSAMGYEQELRAAGATGFIELPVRLPEFDEALRKAIASHPRRPRRDPGERE